MERKNLENIINKLNIFYNKNIIEKPQIKIIEDKNDQEYDKCIIIYIKNGNKKELTENIYKSDLDQFENGIKFLYENNFKETTENIQMLIEEVEEYFLRYNKIKNLFSKFSYKNDKNIK